jgi:hypothetical protein
VEGAAWGREDFVVGNTAHGCFCVGVMSQGGLEGANAIMV